MSVKNFPDIQYFSAFNNWPFDMRMQIDKCNNFDLWGKRKKMQFLLFNL